MRPFKLIFFINLLFLFPDFVFPQTCKNSIEGEIFEGETNTPIANTLVQIKQLGLSTLCDSNGYFLITGICTDTATLEISYPGYKTYFKTLKMRANLHLDIELHLDECILSSVEIQHHRTESPSLPQILIDKKTLEKNYGKSLGSLLRHLPGVDATQSGPSIFKPSIHGLSGNRIAIIQNGVRLEGQNWGNDHAPEIDPFAATQIVVLKSTAAILYGPEAQSGAIVLETSRNPNPATNGHYISHLASNNRQIQNTMQLNIAQKKFPNQYLSINISQKRSGNYKTPETYLDNTGNFDLTGGFTATHISNRDKFELIYNTFNQKIGIYTGAHIGSIEDLIKNLNGNGYTNSNKFSFDINRSYQETKHNTLQINNLHKFKNSGNLKTMFTMQLNKRKEYDLHRPKNDLSERPNVIYDLKTYQADFTYHHRIRNRWIQKTGTNISLQNNISNTTNIRLFIPNYLQTNASLYHLASCVLSKTQIDLGVRADYRKLNIFRYVNNLLEKPFKKYLVYSGSMGINHVVSKALNINYYTSLSIRPPAVNEQFSDGLHHGESIFIQKQNANFGLKPEQTLSNNIQFSYNKYNIRLDITGYYNRINNFIYLTPTLPIITIRGAFPTYLYSQSNLSITGLDFGFNYTFNKILLFEQKTSWSKPSVLPSKNHIIGMPPPKTSQAVTLFINRIKSEFSINYSYVFKQPYFPKDQITIPYNTENGLNNYTLVGDYSPAPNGFGLWDIGFQTEFKIGKQNITTYLNIHNMLNKKYRNYLNKLRYYIDEQGRNLTIGAKLTF